MSSTQSSRADQAKPGERIAVEPGKTLAAVEVFLREDHDMLSTLAENILKQVTEGDREDCARAISTLQQRLAEHLDTEERELIPSYAKYDPKDAARILDEHATIRRTLANLDVESDLHLVRAEALRSFLVAIRAHAARENSGLYRFARSTPDPR
jgi:hemerythrin-like domain-containing protein